MDILHRIATEGGIVMIPLLVCSIIALGVFLERATYLQRGRVIPRALRAVAAEPSDEAEAVVRREAGTPFGSILAPVVGAGIASRDDAVERMEVAARQVTARLERGLVVLEVIVGIAPLLGLLGTVLGLVHVFEEMGAQQGAEVFTFSRGIAEALWTTVVGLAIAIPTLVVHRSLQRKTEMLMLEMEQLAHAYLQHRHARD